MAILARVLKKQMNISFMGRRGLAYTPTKTTLKLFKGEMRPHIGWGFPDTNTLKCNVDGSVPLTEKSDDPPKGCGTGYIFRDHRPEVLKFGYSPLKGKQNPDTKDEYIVNSDSAECHAILHGVEKVEAVNKENKEVWIESDGANSVNFIKGISEMNGDSAKRCEGTVSKIKDLVEKLKKEKSYKIDITSVLREANFPANFLASMKLKEGFDLEKADEESIATYIAKMPSGGSKKKMKKLISRFLNYIEQNRTKEELPIAKKKKKKGTPHCKEEGEVEGSLADDSNS